MYNFTVIIADEENIPPQLEDMADFVDKQITDNEGAIKKYILNLAKFEKLELDENNIEKIIKELKAIIKKYSGRKQGRPGHRAAPGPPWPGLLPGGSLLRAPRPRRPVLRAHPPGRRRRRPRPLLGPDPGGRAGLIPALPWL